MTASSSRWKAIGEPRITSSASDRATILTEVKAARPSSVHGVRTEEITFMDAWEQRLRADHEQTEQVLATVEQASRAPDGPSRWLVQKLVHYVKSYLDPVHHAKEETILFPRLVERGLPLEGGPIAQMLIDHEHNRALWDRLEGFATRWVEGDRNVLDELRSALRAYAEAVPTHFWKENDVLYPMARRLLSSADAEALARAFAALDESLSVATIARGEATAREIVKGAALPDLAAGLSLDVVAAIFNTLPVELSFVDHDDVVRYFSHEHGTKIFPRTRSAIGTNVRNCHPEKSLSMVERILEDMKAGLRDVAEFWMDFQGTKVHIRYFAVRNPAGRYLGCLEVVQDVGPIQKLEGQRRLLDEAPRKAPPSHPTSRGES